jgi:(p)ppGpp synthase/HD superfamily hydrolase
MELTLSSKTQGDRSMAPVPSRWDRAFDLAAKAHEGQTDKVGKDFFQAHVLPVAAAFDRSTNMAIAALLHDTVEDTDVTLDDIEAEFGTSIRDIVDALTRREGEGYTLYLLRVKRAGEAAVRVKLADVHNNLHPERLRRLDAPTRIRLVRKYTDAYRTLNGK